MIKVISAYYELHLCPMVIVGKTADGSTVYARVRWGHLSVRIDPRDPAPHGGAGGQWIVDKLVDDDQLAGWIEYDELKKVTEELVEWPDNITERPPLDNRDDDGGDNNDDDDLRRFLL